MSPQTWPIYSSISRISRVKRPLDWLRRESAIRSKSYTTTIQREYFRYSDTNPVRVKRESFCFRTTSISWSQGTDLDPKSCLLTKLCSNWGKKLTMKLQSVRCKTKFSKWARVHFPGYKTPCCCWRTRSKRWLRNWSQFCKSCPQTPAEKTSTKSLWANWLRMRIK